MESGAAGQELPRPISARFWPAMSVPRQGLGCPLGEGIPQWHRQGQCSEGSPCAKTFTRARVESGSACRQEPWQQYPAALAVRTRPCSAQNTGHRLKTRRVPVVSTAQALLPVFPGTACLRLPALLPCPVGVKPQRVFGSRLADPCGKPVHGPGQAGGPIPAPGIKGHQDDLSRGAELPRERCLGGLGRGGRIPPPWVICCPS